MIEHLPLYVSIVFILTTLLTIWLFLRSIPSANRNNLPSRILSFVLPFWLLLQGVLGIDDFYRFSDSVPPRFVLFGVLPALIFTTLYFIFFRANFIDRLSLKALTLVHEGSNTCITYLVIKPKAIACHKECNDHARHYEPGLSFKIFKNTAGFEKNAAQSCRFRHLRWVLRLGSR